MDYKYTKELDVDLMPAYYHPICGWV